ncbi:MAG: glycosyltransferase family 4 protein, partial [Chthoniobacterales bacterium]
MRILRTESSRNWGGQEERLLAESEWLVRKGHSVAVACDPESALLKHAKAFPVTCFPVRMRMSLDFLSIISLANIVRKWKPDVIHTTSPKDSWLCFALHAFGIPVVRSRNTSLPARMSATRSFIYRHGCRRVIPTAGFIADVLRIQSKVPADRIDVIGVGVDTAVFHPGVDATAFRKEFEISSEAPLFGVVAMLRREKGQMTFLHAALEILKTHPEYRFVMVGQGTGKSNIEQKLKDEIQAAFPNGNTPIILTGFRQDIP